MTRTGLEPHSGPVLLRPLLSCSQKAGNKPVPGYNGRSSVTGPSACGFCLFGGRNERIGPRSPECFGYFISHLLRMKCPIPPPLKEAD